MLDHPKTRGSILVVSTLILSMLAGLSIATLQNVVTEYKLTTQNQDYNLALSSAQYAVAEAKRLVLTYWSAGAPTCPSVPGSSATPGCIANLATGSATNNGVNVWNYAAFSSAPNNTDFTQQPASYFINNAQATPNKPNPMVSAAPRFFVIDLGCDPYSKVNIYRIIAIGFGASPKTVAYADSQLTMPLTGQNSYANAPVQTVPALLNGNPVQTYNLVLSSNSSTLFFNTSGGSTCSNPGQTLSTGATCEMNCLGEVRVKGYSSFNDAHCPWYYGDWVSSNTQTNTSTLTLASNAIGGTATVTCKAAGSSACPAGQNFNGTCCADSCAPAPYAFIMTGQVWDCSSKSCVCPPGTSMQSSGDIYGGSCCMNIINNCNNGQAPVCGGGCGCVGTFGNPLVWNASMNCCVGSFCVGWGSYPTCGGCTPTSGGK